MIGDRVIAAHIKKDRRYECHAPIAALVS